MHIISLCTHHEPPIPVHCIDRKRNSHQNDPENGVGSRPLLNYVTFGEGIPQVVKTEFVKDSKLEEFTLNGSTVEDRFGQGRERFLLVTTASEYNATTPSGEPGSTLTAQMRQLASTERDRVLIVKLPDEALHLAGQQDTDGETSVLSIINEQVQQQLAPGLQRQASTDSTVLRIVESIHNMVFGKLRHTTLFSWCTCHCISKCLHYCLSPPHVSKDVRRRMRTNDTATSATNSVPEPNEQSKDGDEELPG